MYNVSDNCVAKAELLEGFSATVYLDTGGLPTIGFGRRCASGEPATTREVESAWLRAKLNEIAAWAESYLPGLFQHQVDAIALFLYNTGTGKFLSEPVYELLKGHSFGAFTHWKMYIHDSAGHIDAGLVTRRGDEIRMFIWGDYS